MNDSFSFREQVLRERGQNLKARIKGLKKNDLAAWDQEFQRFEADWKDFQRDKEVTEAGRKMSDKMQGTGGDLGSGARGPMGGGTPVSEHFGQHGRRITTLGRDLNPFQIDERTLDLMSKSVKTGHAIQVKLVDE